MNVPFDRRMFLLGASAALLAACTDGTTGDGAASTLEPSPTSDTTTTAAPADTTTTTARSDDSEPTSDVAPLTAAMFEALPVCTLLPSSTAGPFPTIEQLDRRDITEGYPGHPLRLGIRVVDPDCNPVSGAAVEIWHTDATGDYSSYDDGGSGKDEGAGTTFCRGVQTADADGILEFQTIYPGCYEGRAVHIHVRAKVEGVEVLTAQLYIDEAYTEEVYRTGAYAEFGSPNTTWSSDRIVGDPRTDGTGVFPGPAMTWNGEGSLSLVNLGVVV